MFHEKPAARMLFRPRTLATPGFSGIFDFVVVQSCFYLRRLFPVLFSIVVYLKLGSQLTFGSLVVILSSKVISCYVQYRCVPKIGFSADISIDILTDIFIDIFIDISIDISIDILTDILIDIFIDISIDISIDIFIDILADIFVDISVDKEEEGGGGRRRRRSGLFLKI